MGAPFVTPAFGVPFMTGGGGGTRARTALADVAGALSTYAEDAAGGAGAEPVVAAGGEMGGAAVTASVITVVADDADGAVIGSGRAWSQKSRTPPSPSNPIAPTRPMSHAWLRSRGRWSVTAETIGADSLIEGKSTPGADSLIEGKGPRGNGVVAWMLREDSSCIGIWPENGSSAAASSPAVL